MQWAPLSLRNLVSGAIVLYNSVMFFFFFSRRDVRSREGTEERREREKSILPSFFFPRLPHNHPNEMSFLFQSPHPIQLEKPPPLTGKMSPSTFTEEEEEEEEEEDNHY